jgi:tRNA(Ile)-lysidine synthase
MHPFAQDVAAFAAARGLLDASSRTLVALSGGPDSCALLLALLEVAADGRLPRPVAAAHFHHGMRGADADADAAFAASLCARFGLPCSIGIGAVPAERRRAKGRERRSPHDAARHSRYAFLRAAAAEFGADVIATAHTADDQAETVLLRVLRGAGTEGLTGIPPERPLAPGLRVVRPLLNARRADVEAYCRDRGVTPRRDPSNDSVSYARSRVRRLLPDLARDFNPRIGDALVRLAEIAAADADLLREWTDALWARAATLSPRRVELDAGLLRAEHPALRRRILLRALRHAAADGAVVAAADDAATAANVGAAEKLLVEDRPGAAVDLAGGVRVESDGHGRLRVAFGVAWHRTGRTGCPYRCRSLSGSGRRRVAAGRGVRGASAAGPALSSGASGAGRLW